MPELYVKLDGKKVIEACPDKLEKGIKVTATKEQCDQIMNQRFDAQCDGKTIVSTKAGKDAAEKEKLETYAAEKEAEREAIRLEKADAKAAKDALRV